MNDITNRIKKVYKIFLNLYPIRIQQEYGEEMASVFCNACEDAAKTSGWAVSKLALHEVRDLPGNLIREYSSEIGRKVMYMQSNPAESLSKSVFRGIFSFSFSFTLVYLIYCLIDTFLNFGKILYQGKSLWNILYLHPTALAFGLGAAIIAFNYGKRKVWLSALAAFFTFTLLYRIWAATYLAQRTLAPKDIESEMFIVPLIFSTIAGIIVGGVIGFAQHGWKKAGWFALAGGFGFNMGWIVDIAVTFFVMRQCPYTGVINQLIVGDPWYFLYFVLPVIFYGGIVGMCMGIAQAGVNKRVLMVNH